MYVRLSKIKNIYNLVIHNISAIIAALPKISYPMVYENRPIHLWISKYLSLTARMSVLPYMHVPVRHASVFHHVSSSIGVITALLQLGMNH